MAIKKYNNYVTLLLWFSEFYHLYLLRNIKIFFPLHHAKICQLDQTKFGPRNIYVYVTCVADPFRDDIFTSFYNFISTTTVVGVAMSFTVSNYSFNI